MATAVKQVKNEFDVVLTMSVKEAKALRALLGGTSDLSREEAIKNSSNPEVWDGETSLLLSNINRVLSQLIYGRK